MTNDGNYDPMFDSKGKKAVKTTDLKAANELIKIISPSLILCRETGEGTTHHMKDKSPSGPPL